MNTRSIATLTGLSIIAAGLVGACGGSAADETSGGRSDAGADGAVEAGSGGAGAGGGSSGGAAVDAGAGGAAMAAGGTPSAGGAAPIECVAPTGPVGRCGDSRPPGAPEPPAPPAYTGGTCPALAPGRNTITTNGVAREFLLVVPSDHDGTEPLPLVFLWHWLGGSANSFLTRGQVQLAADQMRFAAVIPEAKDDPLNLLKWPYSIADTDPRQQEEATFFDDMLSCVTDAYPIDRDCVASAGVSAGALWTDQLAGLRGQYLSSIMSLSGGVAGGLIRPWVAPARKMPAFVLWGGLADTCVLVQFQATSQLLQQELAAGCHFQVECLHNCAHAEPPFVAPEELTTYAALWRFFLDHPYWLEPGASPWTRDGIPPGSPAWCGIGIGSATPREGECPPPACPI